MEHLGRAVALVDVFEGDQGRVHPPRASVGALYPAKARTRGYMGTVRPMIRFAAAVLTAALALGGPATASAAPPSAPVGPPHAWIVGAGRSLATPSGHPLFPTLAGRPVAGWLGAFGGEAMATAW